MKPLSKEASDALSALKAADPSAADEARVRKNLERTLGVAIPAATLAVTTTAATAQAATGAGGLTAMSLGAKAVMFVAAVGVGSAITVATIRTISLSSRGGEGRGEEMSQVSPRLAPPPAAPPEVEVTVEAEPVAVAEPQPEAPPEKPAPPPMVARARPQQPLVAAVPAEVEPAPAAVETPEVLTAPPPPPNTAETYELEVETNFPNCDPGTEIRSAQSARKLLTANRAEEAVWLLGAYQKRCPSGRWSDEAWAVRMAGLCKLGRNAEVIGLLQWFSTEYPGRRAAVVTDLRSSCSEEVLKHGEPSAE
jgi:hypothetical protein